MCWSEKRNISQSTPRVGERERETDEKKSHFPESWSRVYYIWPLFPALARAAVQLPETFCSWREDRLTLSVCVCLCVCNDGNKRYSSLANVNDSQQNSRVWHIILRNAIAARPEGSESTWKTAENKPLTLESWWD